jgi:hypothetical protein
VLAGEFEALATGIMYVPPAPRPAPPVGNCPRCGQPVRWKLGPLQPYAHNRTRISDGEKKPIREKCE